MNAINERDEVVGYLAGMCNRRAFVYDSPRNKLRYLGPERGECDPQGEATAINDGGAVVGVVNYQNDFYRSAAYLWTAAGEMIRIAGNTDDSQKAWYRPESINNRGETIGIYSEWLGVVAASRVFYWDESGSPIGIETLIDPADPLKSEIDWREDSHDVSSQCLPAIIARGEVFLSGGPKGHGGADRFFRLVPVSNGKH